MVERLYRAHFTERRSIFEHASLAALAADAGLDGEEARRVLSDDVYAAAVAADVAEARRLGVNGVPFFVLDGRFGVSGAQPVDTFLAALDRARQTDRRHGQAPAMNILRRPVRAGGRAPHRSRAADGRRRSGHRTAAPAVPEAADA